MAIQKVNQTQRNYALARLQEAAEINLSRVVSESDNKRKRILDNVNVSTGTIMAAVSSSLKLEKGNLRDVCLEIRQTLIAVEDRHEEYLAGEAIVVDVKKLISAPGVKRSYYVSPKVTVYSQEEAEKVKLLVDKAVSIRDQIMLSDADALRETMEEVSRYFG
jgi:cysteinyl-tRNA synthetase